MTRNARLELMRQRFPNKGSTGRASQGGGLFRTQNPDMPAHPVRVRWVKLPKPSGRGFVCFGPMQKPTPPLWVATPDPAEPVEVVHKRRTGVPALVKIAVKLLRKRKRGEAYVLT